VKEETIVTQPEAAPVTAPEPAVVPTPVAEEVTPVTPASEPKIETRKKRSQEISKEKHTQRETGETSKSIQ